MPTPFTHLAAAQRLISDAAIAPDSRGVLRQDLSAFLLGHIAADARVSSGIQREDTHFYFYDRPIDSAPWRRMIAKFPELERPRSLAHALFVAAYIAHLAMDATWSLEMVRPLFAEQTWAPPPERFLMLNLLLMWMDRRDYRTLESWQAGTLARAEPSGWLPFVPDQELRSWRDFVASQLPPQGVSATLNVIGERTGLTPDALAAMLSAASQEQGELWLRVPPAHLSAVEAHMYDNARAEMLAYLERTGHLESRGGGVP